MLLTITTTHQPATDLGYLLHKNPARLQSVEITGGQAHVFYPEATPERCTAALLLDLDPIGLVRGHAPGEGFALAQYVNDRPYVASSFLSVALSKAFGTAMNGTCKDRPALPADGGGTGDGEAVDALDDPAAAVVLLIAENSFVLWSFGDGGTSTSRSWARNGVYRCTA